MYILPVAFLFCTPSLQEFYPDSYFVQDGIYQNRPLGFALVFRGNWEIITSPSQMERSSKSFAKQLRNQSAELLFVGTTSERTQGTRGIAINLNIPFDEYALRIQELNKPDVKKDLGLTEVLLNGMPMIRWDYVVGGFRFVEFFFTLDTYNIRIAFWTKPGIFDRFEPVYLDIMSSLSYVSRI